MILVKIDLENIYLFKIDLLSDDEITARINMADANFSFQVILLNESLQKKTRQTKFYF